MYSRLSLHVLVSLDCCLNGLCLRCDWQRSEKFNLTNLSHCCGCCNCESRLPCKDRHRQMRAPQTCTDCPRPFATRKRIHPHLAHTPNFRWPDAALLSVLEFLASFYEHPKTSQQNEVSFPTSLQKDAIARTPDLKMAVSRASELIGCRPISGSPIIWMGSSIHAGTLKQATLYTRLSSVALCNRHFELPRVRSWLNRFHPVAPTCHMYSYLVSYLH